MSRQYDEAMEGRFDLYGTEYKLVEPENADELLKALEVKDALDNHISGLMHDEDASGYEDLMQEQQDYIQEYVDSIGEFDSSIFANNLSYLLKKYGLGVGELENMLGISTGYISRTIGGKFQEKDERRYRLENCPCFWNRYQYIDGVQDVDSAREHRSCR